MGWVDKKVLVTGGEGFIGSHLTERLVELGAEVSVLVKNNFRNDLGFIEDFGDDVKKKLKIFHCDIDDSDAVRSAIKGQDVVFNLAAEISIPYSYEYPRKFVDTNIIGALNVLMACKEYGVSRLMQMSSSEVYGTPDKIPIKEEDTLKGQSPYSATKIAAEKLAESFFKSYGLPVVIARAFNTYGPRQSSRAIVPTIITQALFKDEIHVGNVETTRDLNFVSDIVDGLIKVTECDELIGEVVNIGTGKEISVSSLIEKIKSLTQSSAVVRIDERRLRPEKSEVMRLCADSTKIKKMTGWSPKHSMNEGLEKTIRWIKENPSYFKTGEYQV